MFTFDRSTLFPLDERLSPMIRCTMVAWIGLAALLAPVAEAPAAPPGGGGGSPGGTPGPARTGRDNLAQRDAAPAMVVGGNVVSRSGQPIGGVVVKMFANGVILNSTTTNPEGSFEIEGNPSVGGNNTTVLWFESPGSDRVSSSVILSLGDIAREQRLFPGCTPRLDFLGSTARVEVTMLTVDERNAAIRESGCLGGATAP
jgi:hypothetical protein